MKTPKQIYFSYHIREANTGVRIVGGCLWATSYDDAAERVINGSDISVECCGMISKLMHHRKGREPIPVFAYVCIDPNNHYKGKQARVEYNKAREAADRKAAEQEESDIEEGLALLREKREREKQRSPKATHSISPSKRNHLRTTP